MPLLYCAVDLGAKFGRAVKGRFDGQKLQLEVAHRFANLGVELEQPLLWQRAFELGFTNEGSVAGTARSLAGDDGPLVEPDDARIKRTRNALEPQRIRRNSQRGTEKKYGEVTF